MSQEWAASSKSTVLFFYTNSLCSHEGDRELNGVEFEDFKVEVLTAARSGRLWYIDGMFEQDASSKVQLYALG